MDVPGYGMATVVRRIVDDVEEKEISEDAKL